MSDNKENAPFFSLPPGVKHSLRATYVQRTRTSDTAVWDARSHQFTQSQRAHTTHSSRKFFFFSEDTQMLMFTLPRSRAAAKTTSCDMNVVFLGVTIPVRSLLLPVMFPTLL